MSLEQPCCSEFLRGLPLCCQKNRASSPSSAARATSRARRSPAWLKIKIRPEQELVVGGCTPGEGNAKDLGARRGRRLRGRPAAVRRQGRLRVHRRGRGPSCAGGWRRSRPTDVAVRPGARAEGRAADACAGSGRSSSSGRSSAAGRARATSARPRSRASTRATTRRP